MELIYKSVADIRPGDKVPVIKVVIGVLVEDGIASLKYSDGSTENLPDTASVLVEPRPLPEGWKRLTKSKILALARDRGQPVKTNMTKAALIEALS